jgi:hypothetical protein
VCQLTRWSGAREQEKKVSSKFNLERNFSLSIARLNGLNQSKESVTYFFWGVGGEKKNKILNEN